jgi:hypothetical protein
MTNQLEKDRYVKVMADFGSTGIWNLRGVMADLNDLDVDHDIIFDLGKWIAWFETDATVPHLTEFRKFGRSICQRIKLQKPTWTVAYFDEVDGLGIEVKLWLKRHA